MLILHVHVVGKHGGIERTYDFVRNDGKEELDGCDVLIPYHKDNSWPVAEHEALALIANKPVHGDH